MRFPRDAVSDPLIYNVGQMFKVVTVLRAATINEKECLMALELRGEEAEVKKAVEYFEKHDVQIEAVE
jgi:ABC-type methionine transport system ATPase subunit